MSDQIEKINEKYFNCEVYNSQKFELTEEEKEEHLQAVRDYPFVRMSDGSLQVSMSYQRLFDVDAHGYKIESA